MKKLFEDFRTFVSEDDAQSKDSLLRELEELLKDWPACKDEKKYPMACKYHKDLEDVIRKYGGAGCPAGSHGESKEKNIEEDTTTGPGEGRVVQPTAAAGYIDES